MFATRENSQTAAAKCSLHVQSEIQSLNPRPSTPDIEHEHLVERLYSQSSATSSQAPRQLQNIPSLGAPAAFKRVCMFGGIVRITADSAHESHSKLTTSDTLQDDLAILRYV